MNYVFSCDTEYRLRIKNFPVIQRTACSNRAKFWAQSSYLLTCWQAAGDMTGSIDVSIWSDMLTIWSNALPVATSRPTAACRFEDVGEGWAGCAGLTDKE